MPWAFPAGAGGAAWFDAPPHASLAFYETCAQVLPVLLLVVALEARIVRPGDLRSVTQYARRQPLREALFKSLPPDLFARYARFVYGLLIVLALTGGELAAIHPVLHGKESMGNPHAVMGALVTGLCAILVVAFFGWGDATLRRENRHHDQEPEDDPMPELPQDG